MSDLSDEKLVDASRAGDKEAYAALAGRYYERVFVTCFGMLGSVHDAEDITQDAMLRGLIRIGTLRDSSQFGSWIVRIAKNYCLSLMRRNKYGKKTVIRESGPPEDSLVPYENLQRAIATLPPETRLPLVTYYFGGESVRDVAEKLELSRSAVYQRLRTATNQLHTLLTKQGDVL
ncbi:MAG: sigma-70 family RNA polymerase sigma factor [Phycisphaerales bacterium]|nr:MAG: sigma-70 family RNA polymerase sigma factor [Phycisphaerales bacterium]